MRRALSLIACATLMGCAVLLGVEPLEVDDAASVPEAGGRTDTGNELDGGFGVDGPLPLPETAPPEDRWMPPRDVACRLERVTAMPNAVKANGSGQPWSTPERATTQDDTGATSTACCAPVASQPLRATDFRFAIPLTAKVHGVMLETRARSTAFGFMTDNNVQFGMFNANEKGFDLKSANGYGTAYELRSYGSDTNTSGLPLTPERINRPDFGVEFSWVQGVPTGYLVGFEMDVFRITVFYCN